MSRALGGGAKSGWVAAAILAILLLASGVAGAGTVVSGRDHARLRLPLGLPAADYANAGYRLEVAAGGEALVTTVALPQSQRTPFEPPALPGASALDPVTRLARSLTAGASSQDEASSRILAWLSRNLRYALDRSAPQDAASVLARREGYCTGVARLAVALLQGVGIQAREVPGWVAESGGGYHRWIEVYDPARGWTFSDPLRHHGYVPATYVRLAAETVSNAVAEGGAVISREQRLAGIDRLPASADGVRQVSGAERSGASLRVVVAGPGRGEARLEGAGWRRSLELVGGEALFASLAAGSYRLVIALAEGGVLSRRVELRGRVRAEMLFPALAAGPASVRGAVDEGTGR